MSETPAILTSAITVGRALKLEYDNERLEAEVQRLRGYLETLRGMAGGLADHIEMEAVIEEALGDD